MAKMAILASFAKAVVRQSGKEMTDFRTNFKCQIKPFDHDLMFIYEVYNHFQFALRKTRPEISNQ